MSHTSHQECKARLSKEIQQRQARGMWRATLATLATFVSLAVGPPLAAQEIPSAETNAAPAAASLNGVTYVAWTGKSGPPDSIWYYSSASGSQHEISGTSSSIAAPALASNGSTLYLAWNSEGYIYCCMTNTGSTWTATSDEPVSDDGDYAETAAAPALAVSGSSMYLAWLNLTTNGVEFASNTGSGWNFSPIPKNPGGASAGKAPALAVYGDTIFLAWLPAESSQISYATCSLPCSAWSGPFSVPGTATSGPALGVDAYNSSLYLAWTSGGTISYSEYNVASAGWNPPTAVTGLSAVAPPAPALVSNTVVEPCGSGFFPDNTFSVVYASPGPPAGGYYDLYMHTLFNNLGRCM